MRDVYQFVEAGEDETPADGIENVTVDLRRKGNGAGSPTGLTHVMRGNAEGEKGSKKHLSLQGRPFYTSHSGVGIDTEWDVMTMLLAAANGNHYYVVAGFEIIGNVRPG
jgi:hypothetical protein